jgi:hypothetical protein
MTGSTSTVERPASAEPAERNARQGRLTLTRSVRWLGFWAAIALPAVYLPVLYFGIGANTGAVVLGLLGVQLLALRAGHYHNNDTP